jgi:hypothetical protein
MTSAYVHNILTNYIVPAMFVSRGDPTMVLVYQVLPLVQGMFKYHRIFYISIQKGFCSSKTCAWCYMQLLVVVTLSTFHPVPRTVHVCLITGNAAVAWLFCMLSTSLDRLVVRSNDLEELLSEQTVVNSIMHHEFKTGFHSICLRLELLKINPEIPAFAQVRTGQRMRACTS